MTERTKTELLESWDAVSSETSKLLHTGSAHSFSRHLFSLLGLAEENFESFVRQTQVGFRARLFDFDEQPVAKTLHRVWITDVNQGYVPPEEYLRDILEFSRRTPDWMHVIWTNSHALQDEMTKRCARIGNIETRNLGAYFGGTEVYSAISDFVDDRKYVCASDIARIAVLHAYGGVYADLGVSFSPQILSLIARSKATLNVDDQLMFQLAVLAFPAGGRFLSSWLSFCTSPHKFTALLYPQGTRFSGIEELSFLSGPGFTAAVLMLLDPANGVLVVPQQSRLMQIRSQSSWYGVVGKFGNVIVDRTPATRLSTESHDALLAKLPATLEQRRRCILGQF